MSVFKAIIGVKEDKRRYREYRRRIDELPEDYICPLCKHGAVDFEPIG